MSIMGRKKNGRVEQVGWSMQWDRVCNFERGGQGRPPLRGDMRQKFESWWGICPCGYLQAEGIAIANALRQELAWCFEKWQGGQHGWSTLRKRGRGQRAKSHRFLETILGTLTLMLRELGKVIGGFWAEQEHGLAYSSKDHCGCGWRMDCGRTG